MLTLSEISMIAIGLGRDGNIKHLVVLDCSNAVFVFRFYYNHYLAHLAAPGLIAGPAVCDGRIWPVAKHVTHA